MKDAMKMRKNKVTPEMVKKYWLDICPMCGEKCINACRCPRSERNCENYHYWRRDIDGSAILLTENLDDIKIGE